MNTIGQRIKQLRNNFNLSQQEIADRTGISRGNISNYEKDRVAPASETIITLARFFQVSADWLLTGTETPCGREQAGNPDNRDDFCVYRAKSYVPVQLTPEENELIQVYRTLSTEDKEFIRQIMLLKKGRQPTGQKRKGKSSIS
jgi:transcriptional regulator with XRE-family HTH domain